MQRQHVFNFNFTKIANFTKFKQPKICVWRRGGRGSAGFSCFNKILLLEESQHSFVVKQFFFNQGRFSMVKHAAYDALKKLSKMLDLK